MADIKNNNMDLRFLRTDKALIDAMKDLLANKYFDEITIHDICDWAAVSRTAFYNHYEDKYALVYAWINTYIKPPSELFTDETMMEYFNRLFDAEYTYRNQVFHIMHPDWNKEILWHVDAMWSDGFLQYYKKKYQEGARFDVPFEMMALYNCSGVINLISWNILNNFCYPRDILVSYIVRKIQHSNDFIHL